MFIESLTISGFTGFNDRSFRFEPTINYFPREHRLACTLLDWFLNHSSTTTTTMLDDYSEAAYLEIRIRSAPPEGTDRDRFSELRGVKPSGEDRCRVRLRRDMALPDKVIVDGKGSSLGFEKFRFEMEQLGLVVRVERWPVPLNVVGPQEMAERVLDGGRLLAVVRECFQVDLRRMQADQEQNFKMQFREKWARAMQDDVGWKIAEFKDKIESTQMFRKLQKTLDAMTRGVVERELEMFRRVSQLYETQLRALVEERELLVEKEEVLGKQIDREDSVTNSVLQLMAEDIRLGMDEANCSLAMMEVQEKFLVFNSTLQKKIETLLSTLQGWIGDVQEWNAERFRTYEQLVQTECEIELAKNCLHLRNASGEDIKKASDSLEEQLEVAKERLEQLKISNYQLEQSLQEGRAFLAIQNRVAATREGQTLIEQLAETAQEDLKAKLTTFRLNKQLYETETIIADSVKLSECLSLESIRALAQLRHVVQTTRDDLLKSNFVGFAYEHLKFIDSTVSKLVLPQLEHIYTMAIFESAEAIQKLLQLLPPNISYNLLALDTFNQDEPLVRTPPNLHPLAVYLHDSSLKPILSQLLSSYYCTTSPYDDADGQELPETITVIYLAEDITRRSSDGFLSYGHPPSVEFLADTIVNCVALALDGINIQRQLAVQRDTAAQCRRVMEQILADLIATGEDTFERFDDLNKSRLVWEELPSVLERSAFNQRKLIEQQYRVTTWTSLLERMDKRKFNDAAFYKEKVVIAEDLLVTLRGKINADQKVFHRKLSQFKDDLWSLRELLIRLEELREFGLPLELHQLLMTYWREYKEQLNEAFETVGNDLDTCDLYAVSDELDHLQRESDQVHQKLLTVNDRLKESDRLFRELRIDAHERLKNTREGKSISKDSTLRLLYESKKKLFAKDIQPPYEDCQLDQFKLKLDLLREQERFVSEFRTTHVTNLVLQSVTKLGVMKLRLVTQMLGAVPGMLTAARVRARGGGGGQLRLNFEYDRTKCVPLEEAAPEMNSLNLHDAIGLSIKFIPDSTNNDNDHPHHHPFLTDSALMHLLFYVCFLSVQGCRLLILQACLDFLSDADKLQYLNLLATVAKGTQIFVDESEDDDVFE